MNIYWIAKSPNAILPSRGTSGSVGFDLSSIESYSLGPGERKAFSTGLGWNPAGLPLYMKIEPRSGLAYKFGIDTLAGVIDSDYTGEIKVILINLGPDSFEVKIGDRIAQAVVLPMFQFDSFEFQSETTLVPSPPAGGVVRGSGGFGSTGI